MSETKKVFYELQFNVVSYSAYGVPIQVCFHGPKAMGFSSIEMAQKVVDKLTEGDTKANQQKRQIGAGENRVVKKRTFPSIQDSFVRRDLFRSRE